MSSSVIVPEAVIGLPDVVRPVLPPDTLTDDTLAPVWRAAYERVGRYAFAMIPYVAPGSRVRLAGDGPSSWTCWIMVSRPRRDPYATWGTLPGAYVLPPGQGGALPVVGGKPLWLMEQLVRDYSREGDLVCDPCCSAGTTLVAALRLAGPNPTREGLVKALEQAHDGFVSGCFAPAKQAYQRGVQPRDVGMHKAGGPAPNAHDHLFYELLGGVSPVGAGLR